MSSKPRIFGLAAGSRRRRRLMLFQQQETVSSVERPLLDEEGQMSGADSTGQPLAQSHGVLLIRDMLEDAAPRTWLFTGDTLGFDARKSKRGWVEFFSDTVKIEMQRRLDVVLDTAVKDSLVSNLRRNADWRILRFQPDVVFLMPGPRESIAGNAGYKRFQVDLTKLIEQLEGEGTVVGLCTPPNIPGPDELFADLAAYVDITRQVADETDAILIDHWAHWSQLDSSDSLLDATRSRPNFYGHQKLARHLLRTVGISERT